MHLAERRKETAVAREQALGPWGLYLFVLFVFIFFFYIVEVVYRLGGKERVIIKDEIDDRGEGVIDEPTSLKIQEAKRVVLDNGKGLSF